MNDFSVHSILWHLALLSEELSLLCTVNESKIALRSVCPAGRGARKLSGRAVDCLYASSQLTVTTLLHAAWGRDTTT